MIEGKQASLNPACPRWLQKGPMVFFGASTTAARQGTKTFAENVQDYFSTNHWNVPLINAGIPGHSTVMAKERFEADVLAHSPSCVVVQFGINDSMVDVWKDPPATEPRVPLELFLQNLQYFATKIRSSGGKVFLVTQQRLSWTPKLRELYGRAPYRPSEPDGLNGILDSYAAATRTLAREEGIPLVDVHDAWLKFPGETGEAVSNLLADGMHPNDRGHEIIASLLMEKILALE